MRFLAVLLSIALLTACAPTDKPQQAAENPVAASTAEVDLPSPSSEAPAPTVAPARPAPTATPQPPPPPPAPEPVVLRGRGQFATSAIKLPSSKSLVTFTHTGRSNFIVYGFIDGKKELLVNTIGAYDGQRPLEGSSVVFDIQADGPWTATVDTIPQVQVAAFAGRGDQVSGLFNPPSSGPWEISHSGQSNFIVYLRCAGGSDLIQNQIGPMSGSRVVSPKRGPCYWEVRADGNWSLRPR